METNNFKVINRCAEGDTPSNIICRIKAKEIYLSNTSGWEWEKVTQNLHKGDQVIMLEDPKDISYHVFNCRYEDLRDPDDDVWSSITFDELHPALKSVYLLWST